ncbi:MAG: endonuclease III domain-containing protein [Puniceicoccaceae bacterium]
MTKAERVAWIDGYLNERFPNPPVPLDHRDPYTLLVAVLLSAQCTDVRVNQITPKLFAEAADPAAMVALGEDRIREIIRPCGLAPAKARGIYGLSQILLSEHGGEVPQDLKKLEELPGVGHKTASVVMVQWFGVPAFPVDTHIFRLARTWRLSSGKSVEQTERDLKRLFRLERWADLHLQIIFFGREVCPARTCDGVSCPICKVCFPERKPSPKGFPKATGKRLGGTLKKLPGKIESLNGEGAEVG